MPPKKKKVKRSSGSTPEKPEEPSNYIARVREKSGKRFVASRKKSINYDIEQNVRDVQALLNINAEIFARCMTSASNWNNYNQGKFVTFTRYGFNAVNVRRYNNQTQFVTENIRSQQNFDMKPLSELPPGLDDVFVVKHQPAPFNAFIDYDAFFESAIMLHDDVLETFLAKLKQHIESIHVFLGKIETWLLEPNSNIEFLEATFGKKPEIRTGDNYRSVVLKTCNEPGTYERTFEIAKQSDQAKLKKFLEFVTS